MAKKRPKKKKLAPDTIEAMEDLGLALGLPKDVQLSDMLTSAGEPEGMLVAMLTDLATVHGVKSSILGRIPWNKLAQGMLEMKAIDTDILRASYLRHHAGFRGEITLDRTGNSEAVYNIGDEVMVRDDPDVGHWDAPCQTPAMVIARVPAAIEPGRLPGLLDLEKRNGELIGVPELEARAYDSYLIKVVGVEGLLWPYPKDITSLEVDFPSQPAIL